MMNAGGPLFYQSTQALLTRQKLSTKEMAISKVNSGQVEEGVEMIRTAMRLDLRYTLFIVARLTDGLVMLGRYEDAKTTTESILSVKKDVGAKRLILPTLILTIND